MSSLAFFNGCEWCSLLKANTGQEGEGVPPVTRLPWKPDIQISFERYPSFARMCFSLLLTIHFQSWVERGALQSVDASAINSRLCFYLFHLRSLHLSCFFCTALAHQRQRLLICSFCLFKCKAVLLWGVSSKCLLEASVSVVTVFCVKLWTAVRNGWGPSAGS